MHWSHNSLWKKTKIYIQRALDEPERNNNSLFPFWATIALEFLGRATLAKIHPSLLADPQNWDNILYACGYEDVKRPVSIPAKTVFSRCESIVPGFTKHEHDFVISLIEKRNEELHSGGSPFIKFSTEIWLTEYYRICKILLAFQGLTLVEFLGGKESAAAEKMIEASLRERKKEVIKIVEAHKIIFKSFSADKKEALIKEDNLKKKFVSVQEPHRFANCPACESECVITGELIRATDPISASNHKYFSWEQIVLPTSLTCSVCGLKLEGYESLHVVQLGGQFTLKDSVDFEDDEDDEDLPF